MWRPHILCNDLRHFFRIRGESSGVSKVRSIEGVDANFKFAMSERRTHLIYNIDKCRYIVPKEATDCDTHILTRKMTSVRDGSRANARLIKHPQAGASELRKRKNQEAIRVPHKAEGGAKGVPLSNAEVVAA